jgi:hypothetical protein
MFAMARGSFIVTSPRFPETSDGGLLSAVRGGKSRLLVSAGFGGQSSVFTSEALAARLILSLT